MIMKALLLVGASILPYQSRNLPFFAALLVTLTALVLDLAPFFVVLGYVLYDLFSNSYAYIKYRFDILSALTLMLLNPGFDIDFQLVSANFF